MIANKVKFSQEQIHTQVPFYCSKCGAILLITNVIIPKITHYQSNGQPVYSRYKATFKCPNYPNIIFGKSRYNLSCDSHTISYKTSEDCVDWL